MNKDIVGFLAKTLNRENDAVASLFNDDGSLKDNAVKQFEDWDAERVTKLKSVAEGDFNQGYKKGQAKAAANLEKLLKSTFEFESESTGEELISELAATVTASKGKGTLTDDDVKKHPVFINAEKTWKKQVTEATETARTEIEKFKGEQARKERFATVKEKALEKVLAKNPILPEDQAKAKIRLQRDVIDPLNSYDFEVGDDGNIVVLKEGKRVEDKHGNAVSFDDLVLEIASQSLDFKKHEERRSPNGNNPPPAGTGQKKQFVPKDEKEYQAYLANKEVPAEERAEVVKAWNTSKQQG